MIIIMKNDICIHFLEIIATIFDHYICLLHGTLRILSLHSYAYYTYACMHAVNSFADHRYFPCLSVEGYQ